MPNKTLTFKTDILPNSDVGYNLGDSTNRWVVNGFTLGPASEEDIASQSDVASLFPLIPDVPVTMIGACSSFFYMAYTVPSSSWQGSSSPYTATVSCSRASEINTILVIPGLGLTKEQFDAVDAAKIMCSRQSTDSFLLTAYGTKPTIDLPLGLLTIQDSMNNALVVTVTGTNPVIAAEANHRYICGEVSTISITPPAYGICDVVFTSGSVAAELTLPNNVRLPSWFSTGTMDINTTYEINIMDGIALVSTWEANAS